MAIKASTKAKRAKWLAIGRDDYVGNAGQILFSHHEEKVVREWVQRNGALFTEVRRETNDELAMRLAAEAS